MDKDMAFQATVWATAIVLLALMLSQCAARETESRERSKVACIQSGGETDGYECRRP